MFYHSVGIVVSNKHLRNTCIQMSYVMLSTREEFALHISNVVFAKIARGVLACKQALPMGYSQICLRISRGGRETGEPAMVLVRFEYLRSDSERKLMIGQFDLTHVI